MTLCKTSLADIQRGGLTLSLMWGYEKGTDPVHQMEAMREAFARACTAIYAGPDPEQAMTLATELGDLTRTLQGEAAAFRGYLAAYLRDYYGLTTTQIGKLLGVSHQRASDMISTAKEKGNPVTEPATLPELPHVVLPLSPATRACSSSSAGTKCRPTPSPAETLSTGKHSPQRPGGGCWQRQASADQDIADRTPDTPEEIPRDGLLPSTVDSLTYTSETPKT